MVLCLTAFSCSEQSLDEELRELCKKENVYYVICQISKQDFTESDGRAILYIYFSSEAARQSVL